MTEPVLFSFVFKSDMTWEHVSLLEKASGMRISGAGEKNKAQPGQGFIAPGVKVTLERDDKDCHWRIVARDYSHGEYDYESVKAGFENISSVMPQISDSSDSVEAIINWDKKYSQIE